VAPAIANALKNATGVRFASLPFTAAGIYAQLANERQPTHGVPPAVEPGLVAGP
jgi:hypothetical protein